MILRGDSCLISKLGNYKDLKCIYLCISKWHCS